MLSDHNTGKRHYIMASDDIWS